MMNGIQKDLGVKDPTLHYLMENAETLIDPKLVRSPMDWLVCQKENG